MVVVCILTHDRSLFMRKCTFWFLIDLIIYWKLLILKEKINSHCRHGWIHKISNVSFLFLFFLFSFFTNRASFNRLNSSSCVWLYSFHRLHLSKAMLILRYSNLLKFFKKKQKNLMNEMNALLEFQYKFV